MDSQKTEIARQRGLTRMTGFIDRTDDCDRATENERYIRTLDDRCYISVLYRLTGFGHYEWETAIIFIADVEKPTWRDRECLIIKGDRREELADVPKDKLREWYDANIEGNRNSMETLIEEIKCGLETGA